MNGERLIGTLLAPGSKIPLFGQRQAIGPWIRRAWWHSGQGKSALVSRRFPGVLVLAYHGVRPQEISASCMTFAPLHIPQKLFEAHCELFAQYCDVLSADQWLAVQQREQPPPPRGILLTFDDGYRNALTHVAPILRRFGLRGLFFVCSGPARAKQLHWYDALARQQGESAVAPLRAGAFDRWTSTVSSLDCSCERTDPLAVMTPEEIAALASIPGMTVGAHTVTHPPLAGAAGERQEREMADCAKDLAEWTGQEVRFFAYPTGRRPADYDDRTVSAAAKAGFVSAFTTDTGFASPDRPALEQPRHTVVDGWTVPELAYRLTYVWR